MRDKIFSFTAKHPIWVILVCLTFAVISATGAQKLVFKADYEVFFGKDNPTLLAFEAMQNIYDKSDNVSFIVVPKDKKVFSAKHLAALKSLTKQSWQIPHSTRVDSVTNFQHTYALEDDMIVDDLVMDPSSLSSAQLSKLEQIALAEPTLINKIISEQAHASVVNVTMHLPAIDPMAEGQEIVASVRAIQQQFLAEHPDTDVYLSGMVMLNNAFTEASLNDAETLIPLMFLIVVVTLGVLLRSITGTLATVLVIGLSIATTMGLAGWLGFFLTGPSASAPTMILTLAVADCVHILASMFYEMRHGADKLTAIKKSLQLNLQPIFLTSITTAIGFLSMNFSDSPPFRDLGNLVAIGVMLAFIFSVTIFPAVLRVLPLKVRVKQDNTPDTMSLIADFVIKKRKLLLPLVSLLIVIFAAFIPNNELNDDFIKYFDETVPFRQATDYMQENLSGMTVLEISLGSGQASGINAPEFLEKVANFSDWLRQQPQTDHLNTITDILKRLNKNMHGDDQSWYKLPESQEMSSQYLLLYEMSLPYGLDLNGQLNVDKSSTRMIGTFKNQTSNQLLDLEREIRDWFKTNAPQYPVEITSLNLMGAHLGQQNIASMLIGTSLALILISILLGIALRSWRYGVLSLLPNLMPAAVGFGIWGIYEGQVGLGLSVVIGMTLGIVVDDTVHFLSKYLHARNKKQFDPIAAVHYAFGNVGQALWITTLVLVAGFTVLAQSSFKLNADMGLLTAITIFIALVIDFLFLPPLLMAIDKGPATIKRSESALNDQATASDLEASEGQDI